jgi:hypothetical protein
MTLYQALERLEKKHYPKCISMIEIEDGSGVRFNYRVDDEPNIRFIDFIRESNEKEKENNT